MLDTDGSGDVDERHGTEGDGFVEGVHLADVVLRVREGHMHEGESQEVDCLNGTSEILFLLVRLESFLTIELHGSILFHFILSFEISLFLHFNVSIFFRIFIFFSFLN